MALNQIEFLRSPSVSVTNGTKEITVTGSVDCSGVYSGTAVFINNEQVVEAVSGTGFNPVTGESTITLRYNWDSPTVTAGTLIGFNSIEGLNSVVTRLNEILNAIPDFTQFTGAGLIYSDGNGGYSVKQITTFGESVINAADAAALNAILGNPDFSPLSGFAGVLKKDALDNYSLISSTTFGESLLTQTDATTARATLGITDPSTFGASLITQTDAASARGVLNITDPSAFGESLVTQLDASSARGALGITDPSSFGQTLITQTDADAVKTTLGITDPSSFGQTLITQSDAASARSTLGVASATEVAEGLIRKQTQTEALAGTDDSGAMSAEKVHQAFGQYGLGLSSGMLSPPGNDVFALTKTGFYGINTTSGLLNTPDPQSGSTVFASVYNASNQFVLYLTRTGQLYSNRKNFDTWEDWREYYTNYNIIDAQNVSGSTVTPNSNVSGASLSPAQTGTWRNVCGSDVANSGYGLFKRV